MKMSTLWAMSHLAEKSCDVGYTRHRIVVAAAAI